MATATDLLARTNETVVVSSSAALSSSSSSHVVALRAEQLSAIARGVLGAAAVDDSWTALAEQDGGLCFLHDWLVTKGPVFPSAAVPVCLLRAPPCPSVMASVTALPAELWGIR